MGTRVEPAQAQQKTNVNQPISMKRGSEPLIPEVALLPDKFANNGKFRANSLIARSSKKEKTQQCIVKYDPNLAKYISRSQVNGFLKEVMKDIKIKKACSSKNQVCVFDFDAGYTIWSPAWGKTSYLLDYGLPWLPIRKENPTPKEGAKAIAKILREFIKSMGCKEAKMLKDRFVFPLLTSEKPKNGWAKIDL